MSCRVYLTCFVLVAAGCEVHVGDGDISDWDFDSGSDSGSDDADAGPGRKDAGAKDSGARDSGPAARDAATDATGDAGLKPVMDPVKPVAQTLARGFCDALVECMGAELALEYLNGQSCSDFLSKQLADREIHFLGVSVQRGRAAVHFDQLDGCAADLKAQGCSVVSSRLPSTCEEAVAGYVAMGDECGINQDCEGTFVCTKDNAQCPGHCTQRVGKGVACTASTECENGLLCRSSKCVSPPIEGDPCSMRMSWCAPGLVCQGEAGKEVCSATAKVYTAKENESCDAYGTLCLPELVCVSQGGREGRCERRAASGGVCGAALPAQCPISEFCKDLTSPDRVAPGVAGTCTPKPKPGKECGDIGCQPGSVCSSGMCVAYGVAGDPCVGDGTCYGGKCVDGKCEIAASSCEL